MRDRIAFEYALGGRHVCKAVFVSAHCVEDDKLPNDYDSERAAAVHL